MRIVACITGATITSGARAWYRGLMLHSLLVPLDLSPISDRVAARVALLPLDKDAQLTLLHVLPKGLPPKAQRSAEQDAKKALSAVTADLRHSLAKTVALRQIVKAGSPAVEIGRAAKSVKADLIVMGRGGGRALRDTFLGSTAERVIRQVRRPVLVVRLPARAPYRLPAAALDFDDAAQDVIALLLRLFEPPRPRVTIIHAYDVPYRGMIYPSLSHADAEEYREQVERRARTKLNKLLATALERAQVPSTQAPSWKFHIEFGPPRLTVERVIKRTETDLLALGTQGHRGVLYAMLGTVAGDVLRNVACDVLVAPALARNPRGR